MDKDFSGLLACYSDKGRTGFNPIMLYSVVTYANMRGVRAVDRFVELCERDLAFIWLTKGQRPNGAAFYNSNADGGNPGRADRSGYAPLEKGRPRHPERTVH